MPKKNVAAEEYQTLRSHLDEVLAALQSPEIAVDEAMQLYERGLALAEALRAYLEQAENKLERIKLRVSESA